ncbi:MAG: methyltransferase domain-containing protein [Desulfuromonadales bacterium]|jgi:D-alanine-D-alanine ligase
MKIDVNPNWWKTLFDETYLMTDARSVCDPEITRREVDAVCALLPVCESQAILDLCGGQGRHSLELARRGFTACTVFDYSQALLDHGLAQARDARLPVDFVQGDAVATDLPAVSFDHVLLLGNSLGYLPESVDDLRILQEVHRVLRPGGRLMLDVTDGAVVREKFNPNAWHEIDDRIVVCRQRELAENTIRAREMVLCKNQGLVRDECYAVRLYDPPMLEQLLTDAGFVDLDIRRGFSAHDQDGDYGFMNHRLLVTAQKPTA